MSKPWAAPIGPDEFAMRMRLIVRAHAGSPEAMHGAADVLIEKTLRSLGYDEGVTVFMNMEKWYA